MTSLGVSALNQYGSGQTVQRHLREIFHCLAKNRSRSREGKAGQNEPTFSRSIAAALSRCAARVVAQYPASNMLMPLRGALRCRGVLLSFRRFAVYSPSDGELDPSPIAEHLVAAGKVVALPVVERSRLLSFYRYRKTTRFVRNRFDIPEPDTRNATPVPLAALDVVLMPLVAFDDTGERLGRGGGYYDATFQSRHRTHCGSDSLTSCSIAAICRPNRGMCHSMR